MHAIVGIIIAQLTYIGSLTQQVHAPARLGLAPDNTVLVTEPAENRIVRFNAADLSFIGEYVVANGPVGIAVAPTNDRYYVSLQDIGKIAVLDADFSFVSYLGEGNPLVNFVRPTDVCVDSRNGNVYVVDGGGDRVYGFNPDGTLALRLGVRGSGGSQFRYPSAITIDEARDHLIVADHDNFRVQVFTMSGVFLFTFGDRNKYPLGGPSEGWVPRTQGLAVDPTGRILVSDAMMSTVRRFDTSGNELSKLLNYGFNPGDLRTPCDLALTPDGLRLFVVSTNASAVEVYGVIGLRGGDDKDRTLSQDPAPGERVAGPIAMPFPRPFGGGNGGHRGDEWPGGGPMPRTNYTGDHFIESPIICGRCHAIRQQPGESEFLPDGQFILCTSCHTAGGQAMLKTIQARDLADPFGTNPAATDFSGSSHAWGVPAVNASADSVGPVAGGEMAAYLTNGQMKCTTCHNNHNSDAGAPYLRVSNRHDAMCKECHAPRNEGLGQHGTHPVGFAYPAGQGEFPAAAAVAPLVINEGNVECTTCHAVHKATSGGANGGAGDGRLLRQSNDATLCLTCHTEHMAHAVTGSWQPTCLDCHNPHDPASNNGSLVARTIHSQNLGVDRTVIFTDPTVAVGPGGFVDPDPGVYGICEACHDYPSADATLEVPHTTDGTMPVCTQCHSHKQAFQPGLVLPPNQFAGAANCAICHSAYHANWDQTNHQAAWNNLPAFAQTNPACLPCHTVGYGAPDGYVDQATTPGLAGVQCENCHGAAREHAVSPRTTVPTIDRSAALCGACHQDVHHPTFEEWSGSGGHANSAADAHSSSCTVCHAPLGQQGTPPAYLNVECAACHNPHARTGNAADPPPGSDYQLRRPEFVATVPSNVIADTENPNRFNLCGSCHHTRSSNTWQTTNRPPHHSVQGNMFVGEMAVPASDPVDLVPFLPSVHMTLNEQCNTCHMHKTDYLAGPPEVPASTGHSWAVNYEACAPCHNSAAEGEALAESVRVHVQARLDVITAALGDPATWEYSTAGGPADQSTVPVPVKKTRFLKKYIENDGSLGVHNADYVESMLDKAYELMGIPPTP
ncbi:MAG: hypothetical protein HZB38_08190 [Planctomycetes bacterium]|nr:hypothetical protein [Planctomycetota bacterium]